MDFTNFGMSVLWFLGFGFLESAMAVLGFWIVRVRNFYEMVFIVGHVKFCFNFFEILQGCRVDFLCRYFWFWVDRMMRLRVFV